MDEITVENNLDKECNALGGLFQHIVDETKVGIYFLDVYLNLFWCGVSYMLISRVWAAIL